MCARQEALCACPVSPLHEIGTDPHVLFERSSEPCCALCESLVLRIVGGRASCESAVTDTVCANSHKQLRVQRVQNSGVLLSLEVMHDVFGLFNTIIVA